MYSMTGFTRESEQNEKGNVVNIEIKSVNNRYTDFKFKMNSQFSTFELELKKKMSEAFKRGTFDISIFVKKAPSLVVQPVKVDGEKIKAFTEMMSGLFPLHNLEIRPTDFLRSEFYLDDEKSEDQIKEEMTLVHKALDKAIVSLKEQRKAEGTKIQAIMTQYLDKFEKHVNEVEGKVSDFEANVKAKLMKKFQEHNLASGIEDNRFMQEIVYYLEKLDVHEEIDRLKIHTSKLRKVFEKDGPTAGEQGREIEFLLQEIHRETNTLGSKSSNEKQTDSVIQMKIILEKLKEQSLNIE